MDTETETEHRQEPEIVRPPSGSTITTGQITLMGTCGPGGHIIIRDWLVPIVWLTADADGCWTTTLTEVDDGTHIFIAELVDEGGRLLATSHGCTIEVRAQAPAREAENRDAGSRGFLGFLRRRRRPEGTDVPRSLNDREPIAPPVEPVEFLPSSHAESVGPAPEILHPTPGSQIGHTVTLYGSAAPGVAVEILDDRRLLAMAEADDTGYWGATVEALSAGAHRFQVRTLDGGSATLSAAVDVTVA